MKLELLKDSWDVLYPDFYNCSFSFKKQLFIESVTHSAREAIDTCKLDYQNDIESLHEVDKRMK